MLEPIKLKHPPYTSTAALSSVDQLMHTPEAFVPCCHLKHELTTNIVMQFLSFHFIKKRLNHGYFALANDHLCSKQKAHAALSTKQVIFS